jgi:4-hydroxybenzoate polyprenyltransferase
MVDREDDVRIGIRTSALTFGQHDVLMVALCYAAFLIGMAWVGVQLALGPAYFAGLAAACGCAIYHLRLIRGRDPAKCFRAFLHNNWLGFAIFAGIVADFALRSS